MDDGNRENPIYDYLGDDSTPCRWWHPDMGPSCARCGSDRIDLHEGRWDTIGKGPFSTDPYRGIPWTTVERIKLRLKVEGEWWFQAAGLTRV